MSSDSTLGAAAVPSDLAVLREEGARCRALWASVVARILQDAARTDADGAAARLWLARPDPTVLAFLDLDPDAVATALARLARCGDHHDRQ